MKNLTLFTKMKVCHKKLLSKQNGKVCVKEQRETLEILAVQVKIL